MNRFLTVSEILIILIAFCIKNVLRMYIKMDSLLSLSYSSTDSWTSILESDALLKANIPLYDGDNIHQPPLMIYLWSTVVKFPQSTQFLIFALIDVLCIWVALKLTNEIISYYIRRQKVKDGIINMKLSLNDLRSVRMYVCLWYAFNPFLAISLISQCTTSFNNLILLILFYQIMKGNYKSGAILCSWLTYISFYPVVLLLALYACLKWDAKKCISASFIFVLSLMSLLGISYYLAGYRFIINVYWHHFYLNDSTPQLNIYWYLMATMFDHFRLFFKCTFQLILLTICGGLTLKYINDHIFLAYMLMWTVTVLKPYQSIGELGLLLSLLPIFKHIFPYIRGGLVTFIMFLCVLCLGPLMQYLWMSSGTANANFYFAITLVHMAAQSHLASSILAAYAKYNFHLKHGKIIKNVDGTEAILRAK